MFNECFEEVSIKCFKQVSSKFQASFKHVSSVFQVRLMSVLREIKCLLREFQGHVKEDKEVSVVFRECFKEVYRCVLVYK